MKSDFASLTSMSWQYAEAAQLGFCSINWEMARKQQSFSRNTVQTRYFASALVTNAILSIVDTLINNVTSLICWTVLSHLSCWFFWHIFFIGDANRTPVISRATGVEAELVGGEDLGHRFFCPLTPTPTRWALVRPHLLMAPRMC